MAIRRHVVLFVLIMAFPVVTVPVLAWIGEHDMTEAIAATDALHQRVSNAARPEPSGIADPMILDQVHRVPAELGRVERFWPTRRETSGGLFGSTVRIKGFVMFTRGLGIEKLRWRITWWRKPVLEEYRIECFPEPLRPVRQNR